MLLQGQGLLDVKVEHGLKDERAVVSKERTDLGIIQYPHRVIAEENAFLCNHVIHVPCNYTITVISRPTIVEPERFPLAMPLVGYLSSSSPLDAFSQALCR